MQTFTFGLTVAVIGMGIVFLELVFLVYVIKAISRVAASIGQKKNSVAAEDPRPDAEGEAETFFTAPEQEGISAEELAVIAAAVACFSAGAVAVKTITRRTGRGLNPWTMAGSVETMQARQI